MVLAWTGDEGQQRAAVASLLATLVILLLALLHTWGWGFLGEDARLGQCPGMIPEVAAAVVEFAERRADKSP